MTPNDITQHEPWEPKTVKYLWFHIIREQVQNGTIAKVGAVPWAVYCAIKSHTGFETGDSWPSNATLAGLVGVSVDTVQRSLKTLSEGGLIKLEKKAGRSTKYAMIDTVKMETQDGQPWATGEKKYVPNQFSEFVTQLQRFANTGNMPTDKSIVINMNIVIGDANTVSLVVNPEPDRLPKK